MKDEIQQQRQIDSANQSHLSRVLQLEAASREGAAAAGQVDKNDRRTLAGQFTDPALERLRRHAAIVHRQKPLPGPGYLIYSVEKRLGQVAMPNEDSTHVLTHNPLRGTP